MLVITYGPPGNVFETARGPGIIKVGLLTGAMACPSGCSLPVSGRATAILKISVAILSSAPLKWLSIAILLPHFIGIWAAFCHSATHCYALLRIRHPMRVFHLVQ